MRFDTVALITMNSEQWTANKYNNAHGWVHDFDSLWFKLVPIIYVFGLKTTYCTNGTKGNDSLIESNSLSKKNESYKIVYFNQIKNS